MRNPKSKMLGKIPYLYILDIINCKINSAEDVYYLLIEGILFYELLITLVHFRQFVLGRNSGEAESIRV